MGVLGITPFLQKTCPHVFKRLPDRLRSLRGKTVVIDGTLVTQRLHFAPMPHPYRHIIGWHRILTELRDSDVRAICVFDGKQRTPAKAREVERRRESRKIDAVRGSIEKTRLHRLEKLMRLLPYYRSLPSVDRQRINDALTSIRSLHRLPEMCVSGSPFLTPTAPTPRPLSPQITSHTRDTLALSQHPSFFAHRGMGGTDLQNAFDTLLASPPSPLTSRSEPHCIPPPDDLDDATHFITGNEIGPWNLFDDPADDISSTLPFVQWNTAVQPTPSPPYQSLDMESFRLELSALYSEYNQCVTQLTSIPSSFEGPQVPEQAHDHSEPADSTTALDARIEYAMTKQQLQMTLDEGHIWNLLFGPSTDSPSDTESALMSLAERSTLISQSYQRRSNSPTTQTYDECKEIVRAMGAPCIDASGPFEAEALACALVLHGQADYVVSEDTDVLVYEAPMLRGITTRESPLIAVHGDTIRATLDLDRAGFVDFALLLGTDFSQRIKNVGPSRALKFIRQHGSIERVVELESKYPPRMPVEEYLAQVGVARLVFQNLPPLPDVALLRQTEGDPGAVSEIVQRYGLHRMLPGAWDAESALTGNYFDDNPSVW